MKPEFSQWIFEKPSDIKISEKSVQWEPRCSMQTKHTNGHEKANSCFPQFRECAKKFNVFIKYSNKVEACVKK